MERYALPVFMALALVLVGGVGTLAADGIYNEYGVEILPQRPSQPAVQPGCGPATCVPAETTCTVWNTCNPDTAVNICGAFCDAGQQPAGWPYGWCDEYWLRPDSNF